MTERQEHPELFDLLAQHYWPNNAPFMPEDLAEAVRRECSNPWFATWIPEAFYEKGTTLPIKQIVVFKLGFIPSGSLKACTLTLSVAPPSHYLPCRLEWGEFLNHIMGSARIECALEGLPNMLESMSNMVSLVSDTEEVARVLQRAIAIRSEKNRQANATAHIDMGCGQ